MSLTQADVERLRGAGHERFFFAAADGTLRLRNVGGRCTFLAHPGGRCRVYALRPEGCQLYPLVLDTECDETILDEICPHREEFSFSSADRRRLRQSIAIEERETAERRGARQPHPR
jgi:Fe-S-cluster containining protein